MTQNQKNSWFWGKWNLRHSISQYSTPALQMALIWANRSNDFFFGHTFASLHGIKMAVQAATTWIDLLWMGCPGKLSMEKVKKESSPHHCRYLKHENLTSSLMCSTCSSRNSFLSVSDLFFFKSDWPIRAANSKSRSFCRALRKESKWQRKG